MPGIYLSDTKFPRIRYVWKCGTCYGPDWKAVEGVLPPQEPVPPPPPRPEEVAAVGAAG